MCLDLKRTLSNPSRVLTARRDYTVYKLLEKKDYSFDTFQTPYQRATYKRGETKTVPCFSASVIGRPNVEFTDALPERSYSIFKGLHAYQRLDRAKPRAKRNRYIVVECTIPKGTKYIRGDWDIVSLSLKVGKALGRGVDARAFNANK